MSKTAETQTELGRRLRTLRDDKGLSRRDLSIAAGVSDSVIVRAELYGHVPTVKNLALIAGVLGADLSDLVVASQAS